MADRDSQLAEARENFEIGIAVPVMQPVKTPIHLGQFFRWSVRSVALLLTLIRLLNYHSRY